MRQNFDALWPRTWCVPALKRSCAKNGRVSAGYQQNPKHKGLSPLPFVTKCESVEKNTRILVSGKYSSQREVLCNISYQFAR